MPHSLEQMEKLQAAKYREICEFIAKELGIELGGLSSPEARASVREVADESIEAWDGASVDSETGVTAVTPLQKLLAEHHAISQRILELLDKDIFGDETL